MFEAKKQLVINDECDLLVTMGYPTMLAKACTDAFDYCLKLKNGDLIRFAEAKAISPEWVLIKELDLRRSHFQSPNIYDNAFLFDRGIEVRISEIVWIADAPSGS